MKGTSHAFVGLAFGVAVAAATWESKQLFGVDINPLVIVLTSAAGGLKSDSDMVNNSGRKGYGFLWKIAEKTPLLNKLFGHRGYATHSYYYPALVFFIGAMLVSGGDANLVSVIVSSLIIGASIGIFSHVFVDVYNGKGEALLFPIPWKFNIMSVTSDTVQETIFIPIFIVLVLTHAILTGMGVTL